MRTLLAVILVFAFVSATFAQSNGQVYNAHQNAPATVRITQAPVVQYADEKFAVIAWRTDVPAESRVYYSTDPNNLSQVAEDTTSTTQHRVHLANLEPGATIYFQVETGSLEPQTMTFQTPAAGGTPLRDVATRAYSQPQAQPAAPQQSAAPANPAPKAVAITRGPTIQYADDRSAVITWSTDVATPTAVYYGTTEHNLPQSAFGDANTLNHRVQITNLIAGTTYFFQIDTGDLQPPVMTFQTSASASQPIYDRPAAKVGEGPQLATRSDKPQYRGGILVPAGTEIQAKLQTALSSKTSRQGDKFAALVTADVPGMNGGPGIPAGSTIRGEVSGVEQGKTISALRGKARLNLRFLDILLPDGQTFPIQASLGSVKQGGTKTNEEGQVTGTNTAGRTAKDVGIGAGIGTVAGLIFGGALKGLAIGAIAGGGYVLATQGKDVSIPADSMMVIRLDQALNLPSGTKQAQTQPVE